MRLSISLSLFVILLFISSCSAIFTKPTNIPQCLYPKGKSPSSPTCFDDPNPSQVKRTTLVLSYQTPPGFPKPIIAINNTYPGPTLEYNQFDMIEVTVVNQLGVDTSLHFHGARQYKTPYSDGVTGLTQCPIGAGLNMTYRLCLDRSGTFWYHGHHGEQTADGFVGAMIVHPQPYGEVYASQYDHDLPLLMADFYNVPSQSLMPFFMSPQSFGHEPVPDQFVVNGKFSGQLAYGFPRTSRVRLRLISAAAFSMFTISLDGYNMTIIEVDGTDVEPYAVTKFALNVAQRVSILIDLSSLPSNVPGLQLHSVADPSMFDPDLISANAAFDTITNIFICDKTSTADVCANPLQPSTDLIPMSKPDWTSTTINSQNYNQPLYNLNVEVTEGLYPASDMNLIAVRPLYPAYATGSNTAACYTVFSSDINKPDAYVPMVMDFANDVYSINRGQWNGITWDNTQYYNNLYQQPQAAPQPRLYDMVKANNPSFQTFLSDPTLISTPVDAVTENTAVGLQGMYPDSFLNNSNNMFNIISPNAIGQYILPHNKTIELMVINQDSGLHPIHFHGYAVYVISSSEMLDAETVNAGNYPLRDVWTLPGDGGWVKIRIITDNPGVWAFHCHITWHFDAGLVAVFIDNLDALQNDPFYSNGSLIPADHQAVCQNYAPNATAPLTNLCVNLVENEFAGTLTPASQTRWAMLADLIIMSECAVGLILYKLNILNYILAELIGMNIGTLVGVVFVELIKETYEKVMITGTMTYVNVTIVMCFGFLFPLFLEKFIKRGRSNKFSKLSSAQNQSQSNNDPNSSTIGTQPLPSPISNFATKNAMSSANLLSNNNNDKIKDESKESADERFTQNGVEMSHIPKQASCVVFHTDNDGAVVVDTTAAASMDTTARFPSSSVGEADEAAQVANQVTKSLDDIQLKVDTTEQQVQTSKKKRASGMERIASMLSSSEGETDYTLIIIILAGEMVDNFVDGGIIASAFLTSDSAGIATAIGVFMEELPHLTGSFAVFVAAGAPIWKCILINITAASAYIVGTGFIMGIASNPSINPNDVFYLLPWAIGTFLYVALVDLTPVITNMPWRGYWRALTACLSVCFGIGIQASVAVYSWKKGTS